MSLYETFCEALHNNRETASNSYLTLLGQYVRDIEDAAATNLDLVEYCKRMTKIAQQPNFSLNGDLVNEFCQIFGEAHFLVLCKERGVSLSKIPEQIGLKTPDFVHPEILEGMHFEVKTLSVVGGGRGINKDLENALEARIQIDAQLNAGNRIAISESVIQPYSDKPYNEGNISSVINTLIDKSRQNIKSEQYAKPNTFLVLNLSMIPNCNADFCSLRPVYCEDYPFQTAVTGDLWMLAFAKIGMQVHGTPRYEGLPSIEGIIQKIGILADEDYSIIAGLIVVIYPLGDKPRIYGLYRYSDYNRWQDSSKDVFQVLLKLVEKYWNDDLDSNGWRLPNVRLMPNK